MAAVMNTSIIMMNEEAANTGNSRRITKNMVDVDLL